MSDFDFGYSSRVGAGRSADTRYRELYRSWRDRSRRGFLLGMLPIAGLMLGLAILFPSERLFYAGLAGGSFVTLLSLRVIFAPEHVDRWRRGAEAEKRTARALRSLIREGWVVLHDLPDGKYGNRDHVVVAPSGEVFLLDTKAPGGQVTVRRGVLHVHWLEDPDDGYEKNLMPRMKAAAAGLSTDLAQTLGQRPWVRPVVVIWGRWDGPPCQRDRVGFVPGDQISARLAANVAKPNVAEQARVVSAVRACTGATVGARSSGLGLFRFGRRRAASQGSGLAAPRVDAA